ncbi:O-linked GlcNAc transferase [Fulvivirga imtechensis AK7]|uniref:O-linked GlcNAc transferase n=1 Tax=Fulvivirga imtechensis AK7 TaxID=1237149 RepID=L8JK09_9BACT|nr:tetratricopeptide repeat protein [Fulvivirga imtechensis]ELR68598.1 O-linked GlcNAc transferase [Fulvivirga imtechensis AK7]
MSKRILFLMALIIASCSDQERKTEQAESSVNTHQPDSNAVKLNNKAVKFIGDAAHTYDSLSGFLYDSALMYLNQALEIDSLYLIAYSNKSQVLRRKGKLEESLEALNKVQNIKPNFAEVITEQGFILEKMGRMELAHQKYSQALKAYEKRLENDPKNDKVLSDIAFLYIFLEDENAALDEIRDLILKNPESEQLKMMEGVIKDFDREKFIEEY